MTLQWTVIAFILYIEIALILLLLLPWIRPHTWKKLFNSRFIASFQRFANVYSYAVVVVLLLLFFDAIREVQKYSHVEVKTETHLLANTDAVIHMRLFRAQRNLYISGFVLLLFLVIKRIVHLLARCAYLEAAAEAAMKQAEGASNAAKNLIKSDSDSKDKKLTSGTDVLDELKKTKADRDAMKAQAEGLQKEYDRVCEELNSFLQKGHKKDD